jgi:hypothetical protein
MSELEDLLDNITSQFSNKINEIYEKKLEEHKLNISTNLCEDYTENYGMFDFGMPIIETRINKFQHRIDKYFNIRGNQKIILEIDNYIKTINKDRYVIHCFMTDYNGNHHEKENDSIMVIFDNYGDFCMINTTKLGNNLNVSDILKNTNHYINRCFTSKYKLPNILIDFIKNEFIETFRKDKTDIKHSINFAAPLDSYGNTNNIIITSGCYKVYSDILKMKPLSVLSEEYYKRFTKDKKIEELIESNKKYIKEIEKLKEEISEKNLLISSFQNNKGNKETKSELFAFSDILFQQIKDLQEQIEEYKKQIFQFEKEKEENSKKYNEMQTKIKKLLDI